MHEFVPGMVARAEEVNDNFAEVMNAKDSDNEIVINGRRYQATGIVKSFRIPDFYASGNWYYGSVDISEPYTPPKGYRFNYYILETSGFSILGPGNHASKTGQYRARIIQVGSSYTGTVSKIGWSLVKAE